MANTTRPVGHLGPATVANVTTTTQQVLQIGPATGDTGKTLKINLLRVKVRFNSGDATEFTPFIFSASGKAAGDFAQEYAGSSTQELSDDTQIDAYCAPDSLGRLYLLFGPSAGTNNNFSYEVWWEVLG